MEAEDSNLSLIEAAELAGVNESTIVRYSQAGFLTAIDTASGEQVYSKSEILEVFEVSAKASRIAAGKKTKRLSHSEILLAEKDRLIADKDIQIQDLRDQRAWLQTRIEKLETELRVLTEANSSKDQHPLPAEKTDEQEVMDFDEPLFKEITPPTSPKSVSTLTKMLQFFGFSKPQSEYEENTPQRFLPEPHRFSETVPLPSAQPSSPLNNSNEEGVKKAGNDATPTGNRPFKLGSNDGSFKSLVGK